MIKYALLGSRIYFRPITDSDSDTYKVVEWRNTDIARKSYFSNVVSTPSGHHKFLKYKDENDFVFMAIDEKTQEYVGMTAVKVDIYNFCGEYGRTFVDSKHRGKGFAEEIEYTLLSFSFDYLNLERLWLDALIENKAIISLHEKTGWTPLGIDLAGHTNEKGPVLHMEYLKSVWLDKKNNNLIDINKIRGKYE